MKSYRFLIFIPCLFFFFGCSEDRSQNYQPNAFPEYEIKALSQAEAHALASNAQVDCNNDNCHDSVGMLSIILPEERDESTSQSIYPLGMCTAFIISPDIVATNAHCIPVDLRKKGSSCRDRLWFNLPRTDNFNGERIECQEILSASRIQENEHDPNYIRLPDFAFLRLQKPTNRPSLPLIQDGLPDRFQLTAIKVNPASDTEAHGIMEKSNCTVIQGSIALPSFNHPKRPITALSGCQTHMGNSGSPLIDQNGSVRAIIHGIWIASKYPEISFATNMACIPLPDSSDGNALSPECQVTPNSSAGKVIQPRMKEDIALAEDQLNGMVKRWGELSNDQIEWTGFVIATDSKLAETLSNNGVGASSEPLNSKGNQLSKFLETPLFTFAQAHCFKNPSTWLSRYKGRLEYDSQATIEINSPIWVTRVGFNETYSMVTSSEETSTKLHIAIQFSPADIHKTGKSKATLFVKDRLYGTLKVGSGIVETCK